MQLLTLIIEVSIRFFHLFLHMSEFYCTFAGEMQEEDYECYSTTHHTKFKLTKTMELSKITTFYFLGIGGIGMSALARFFAAKGYRVLGYDRTKSPLTQELEAEGILVQYNDDCQIVSELSIETTLVVRTPAVPFDTPIYEYIRKKGFSVIKRAEVLGMVTSLHRSLCVAGTHGKTTTSTILAHIMHTSSEGCSAFLGGISNNYHTNLLIDTNSDWVVTEADEYDRSFHALRPYISVITSMDPDHLDIYETEEKYYESFAHYASLTSDTLIIKKGLDINILASNTKAKIYTYGIETEANFSAQNIRYEQGVILFDFHIKYETTRVILKDMRLRVPVWVNIENSVAALAVAYIVGVSEDELRNGINTYTGVYRRFNIHVNTPQVSYIDDYAHHPSELRASIDSVSKLYPRRKIIGVFQPHLFSRTRDFADEFAEVLTKCDKILLLPIYPAREKPIPSVTSEWLRDKIEELGKQGEVVSKNLLATSIRQLVQTYLDNQQECVVLTMGAGDIDRLVEEIKQNLNAYE